MDGAHCSRESTRRSVYSNGGQAGFVAAAAAVIVVSGYICRWGSTGRARTIKCLAFGPRQVGPEDDDAVACLADTMLFAQGEWMDHTQQAAYLGCFREFLSPPKFSARFFL